MTSILPTLYSALEKKYSRDRSGVHVSDITLCPKEAVHRRLSPPKITNTQLGFFIFGKSAGDAIQALVDDNPERWVAEQEVWLTMDNRTRFNNDIKGSAEEFDFFVFCMVNPETDLVAHIDLYDRINNIPIEVKTANKADMDQPQPHYTKQLRAYMAMTNARTGMILVFLTQHFRGKVKEQPFREWVITMTDEQLEAERVRLRAEAQQFQKAVREKNPSLARMVIDDKDLNWKCTYCLYLKSCQEMNKPKKWCPKCKEDTIQEKDGGYIFCTKCGAMVG